MMAYDGYLHRAVLTRRGANGLPGEASGRGATLAGPAYATATLLTTATYETIRDARTPGGEGDKLAKTTTTASPRLLAGGDVAGRTGPGLVAHREPASALAANAGPTHHLADPALACRLLDIGADELLAGRPTAGLDLLLVDRTSLLGALFESLVTLDVRVYAQAAEGRVGHLRTWNDDREVDLIVQKGQRLLAIEVKLTTTPHRHDTRHLRWLADKMGPDLVDSMVVTTGRHAYRDRDGIAIVPAALLGP